MATDYWRGGWAQQNPLRSLPGMQAAAMNGGTYGPLNALADLLGAYWQKKSMEGALGYASSKEMEKGLNEMTAPEYEQVQPAPENGSARAANTAYAQMAQAGEQGAVNTDWLHRGAQVAPRYGKDAAASSLLDAARIRYGAPGRSAEQQAQDQAFAQTKAEHPEWFVGDYYVGDDAKLKKAQEQTQAQAYAAGRAVADQAKSARTGRFASGMEAYGFTGRSRARSYDEVREKANALKSQAMQQIVKRYGVQGAQMAEGMIDKAISERLSSYGDAMLQSLRTPIDTYIQQHAEGLNESKVLAPLLRSMQDYNIAAHKVGAPEYDTKALSLLQKSGETKIVPQNLHGAVTWNLVKANGSPLFYEKDGKPVYTQSVWKAQMLPTWNEQQSVRMRGMQLSETARHNRAQEALGAQRNQISLYNALHKGGGTRSSGGRGSGSSRGGADFDSKAVSSRITDMITKDKGDGSPYTMPEIVEKMKSFGFSKEQIQAYLPPSVVAFYHEYQGDDAPDADEEYYGAGDGD